MAKTVQKEQTTKNGKRETANSKQREKLKLN